MAEEGTAGSPELGGAQLVVLADAEAVAREAARRTLAALGAAISARGAAHIALTGGSSAEPLYRELADPARRTALDWSRVHLWWGDERFVPIDHPDSNTGMAYRLLLAGGAESGIPIDPQHIHPVEVDETTGDSEPVDLAAQLYAAELTRHVPLARGGVPRFDVLLTGLGPDGHLMSIFPGSPALAADAPIAMAIPAPVHVAPKLPRVTLSARVLGVAGTVLMMVSGDAKSEIVARVLGPVHDPALWPAQSALLPNAVWLLDEAAAAGWSADRRQRLR